jgi:hypothetical protein
VCPRHPLPLRRAMGFEPQRRYKVEFSSIHRRNSLARTLTFGVDAMAKDQLGPAGSAAASSDSGSDECRRGLMPATLMRCVKSQ